jgi:hypothetical protein
MTAPTKHLSDTLPDGRSRKGRISPKIREALRLRVEKGKSGEVAAREAGVSPAALWKALTRPHVKTYYESLKADYAKEVNRLKGYAKLRAIEVGLDLMETAQSEAVKARMVEFFSGEGRQPLVSIDLSGNSKAASGYVYARPDRAASDMQSNAQSGQGIEDAEEMPD